jgi:hypothetical protein
MSYEVTSTQAINASVAIVYDYGALYWDTEVDPDWTNEAIEELALAEVVDYFGERMGKGIVAIEIRSLSNSEVIA